MKSATQESRSVSSESDLHLITERSGRNTLISVFNWKTHEFCTIGSFNEKNLNSVRSCVILNGTLLCAFQNGSVVKYFKESGKWEKGAHLGRDIEKGTILPDKGWAMFFSDTGEDREYIKILDNPDGEWKDGPKLNYSSFIDCIIQLNDTTTFICRRDGKFLTFDWSKNIYTEHKVFLPGKPDRTCALMKDENGQSLVAIVYYVENQLTMALWYPADDALVSEKLSFLSHNLLAPALAAIKRGTQALLYSGYDYLNPAEGAVWKYNLALRTWTETGIVIKAKKDIMVLPLDGFTKDDFNCIEN